MVRSYEIKNKGSASLFKNRFLEALTRTHFAFPVTLYFVCAATIIISTLLNSKSNSLLIFIFFPLGVITFSFVEYCIHRFIFHFNASNEREEKIKYHIHGVHHEYPRDKDRLVMPPVLSIILAVLFYLLFKLILGSYVLYFFPGFLSGYSIYLLIHYAVHRYRPPKNFLKVLWTHHALHHYESEDTAFAVSMPIWDHLFNTMPRRKK